MSLTRLCWRSPVFWTLLRLVSVINGIHSNYLTTESRGIGLYLRSFHIQSLSNRLREILHGITLVPGTLMITGISVLGVWVKVSHWYVFSSYSSAYVGCTKSKEACIFIRRWSRKRDCYCCSICRTRITRHVKAPIGVPNLRTNWL